MKIGFAKYRTTCQLDLSLDLGKEAGSGAMSSYFTLVTSAAVPPTRPQLRSPWCLRFPAGWTARQHDFGHELFRKGGKVMIVMMSSFSQPKALNHYSQERAQLFNISLVGFSVTVFLFLNPAKSSYRFYPQAPSRVLSHISDFNPTDTADGSSQPPSFAGNSTTQMRFHPRFFSTMITRQDLGAAAQQHLPSGKLT